MQHLHTTELDSDEFIYFQHDSNEKTAKYTRNQSTLPKKILLTEKICATIWMPKCIRLQSSRARKIIKRYRKANN
jgi:hypothetical protein